MGALCIVLGSMMLVVPHEFDQPGYALLRPALAGWAMAFLAAGTLLLTLPLLPLARTLQRVGSAIAAAPLASVAISHVLAGTSMPAAWFMALAVAVAASSFIPRGVEGKSWWDRPDLLAITTGVASIIVGTMAVQYVQTVPGEAGHALWLGAASLASGVVILAAQVNSRLRIRLGAIAYVAVALPMLVCLVAVAAERGWLVVSFLSVFGTALLVLPWLGPVLMRVDPGSLRTRLGLVLAMTAAAPLLLAVTFVAAQQERLLLDDAAGREQRLASTLAESVNDYVSLHRAAVQYLASQPDLIYLPPDSQHQVLERLNRSYPDIRAFATFDANGQPIARSDDAPLTPIAGFPIFEDAKRTNAPSRDRLISPVYGRSVFAFGVPTRDAAGQFNGIVVAALDTSRVARLLNRTADEPSGMAYLVNARGNVLAHPDSRLAQSFVDLSATPPVAALLASSEPGWLTYDGESGTWLAGFARVREIGWGVVVQQSLAATIESSQTGRTLIFQMLLLFIVFAALGGALIASWLTRRLDRLAEAAGKLAEGDEAAPLPVSSTTEVARLAAAFGEMRDRLVARTAERAAAQEQLRALNASLEERVADRTARLQAAIGDLRAEMAERRRVEAEREELVDQLQFEQARLEAVLRQMPAGVVIVDAKTNCVVLGNRIAEEILDVPLLTGMQIGVGGLGQPVQVDDSPVPTDRLPLIRAITYGEVISGEELRVRRQNGELTIISVSATPIRDVEGAIMAGVLSLTDVTEWKHAQDAERFLSEASSVLAGSLDYEITLSILPQLAVPYLADWCSVHLVEDDKRVRRVALSHIEPDRLRLTQQTGSHYRIDPTRTHGVSAVLRTGRSEFASEVTAEWLEAFSRSPERLAAIQELGAYSYMCVPMVARGRIIGAFAFGSATPERRFRPADLTIGEDLARRAALAVDNARLYQTAQAAIQVREEFLSVAAHELKTPVTSLRGFAQLARRQIGRGHQIDLQRVERALYVIDQQSEKLSRLVTQLLDVSRLEAGKLTLEIRETDVATLVRDAVAAAQASASRHEIVLDAPAAALVGVDPLRFEQVLTNLIDNAIKYSPNGGQIQVQLAVEPADRPILTVAVTDHGLGIPSEHRDRIFDRFYQAHVDSHASGMGLGLYISHEITELHGGELTVEFPEDGGTRFVVRIPTGVDARSVTDRLPES